MQTFVPHVSLYKLGKLSSADVSQDGSCTVKITLRDDFKFDDQEEMQMLELLGALTSGA